MLSDPPYRSEQADSWDTDGHKWFNMPYDSGIVIVREAALLAEAMGGNSTSLMAMMWRLLNMQVHGDPPPPKLRDFG